MSKSPTRHGQAVAFPLFLTDARKAARSLFAFGGRIAAPVRSVLEPTLRRDRLRFDGTGIA